MVRGPNPAALQITLLTISTGTPQSGRTKPAYNQSLANGWLTITASAVNDYGSVLPTVTQNSLHPLSPSSISARHLLDFMAQGKITEADELSIHLDAIPSGLSVPLTSSSHFYTECPFCRNAPNLSCFGTGTE